MPLAELRQNRESNSEACASESDALPPTTFWACTLHFAEESSPYTVDYLMFVIVL